jgi:hypothetical protein
VNPPTKPDRDEALRRAAEDAEAEAAMDRVLAMSDEQVEKELVAQGFDLEKVRGDAAAMAATLEARAAREAADAPPGGGEEHVAPVVELSFYRRNRVLLIAVAALALAGAGVAALALHGDIPILRPENTYPRPRERTPEQIKAAALRAQAREACVMRDATTCRAKLDEAKELDAEGETVRDVVETRRMLEALPVSHGNEKGPGP